MLFIPYRIDAVYPRRPVVNVLIIFVTTAVFLAAGGFSETEIKPLILSDWNWKGLIGHMFLHADVVHLAGNLFFLWMFGNAICANTGNFLYLLVYLVLGVVAGAIHLIFDGRPAIGASGAVNGIIGLALAMYPTDRVSVWYWGCRRNWNFSRSNVADGCGLVWIRRLGFNAGTWRGCLFRSYRGPDWRTYTWIAGPAIRLGQTDRV